MTPQIIAGLGLAATCALATNLGAVLKHRGANAVARFEMRRPLRSTRLLLGSGSFAIGLALAQLAGVFHIAALALAPMSVVQVVLAAGVIVLARLAERLLGCRVPRRQRIGLVIGALGLVLLVLSIPRLHGAHGGFALATLVGFEATVALIGAVLALGPRARRLLVHRGVLLGAAAGTFFGLSDVAVKAITGTVEQGSGPLTLAPLLTLAVAGAALVPAPGAIAAG